jgi:hypothetical protein
MLETQIQ